MQAICLLKPDLIRSAIEVEEVTRTVKLMNKEVDTKHITASAHFELGAPHAVSSISMKVLVEVQAIDCTVILLEFPFVLTEINVDLLSETISKILLARKLIRYSRIKAIAISFSFDVSEEVLG